MKNLSRYTLLFVTITIVSVTTIVGCGERNVPLSGKITFSDNGEPLMEGTIGFVNGAKQARSEIDANGNYKLGFQADGNGLPKGEYKIYIQAVKIENTTEKDATGVDVVIARKETPLIAQKYAAPNTSGLTFTVDGKQKTFDIAVERAEK